MKKKTEEQILQILSKTDSSGGDRVKAVLSALFYGETIEFSADVLIKEFSEANYYEKRWLKNLFATFYGMCRVDYRIDESIALLKGYKTQELSCAGETQSIIDELNEYRRLSRPVCVSMIQVSTASRAKLLRIGPHTPHQTANPLKKRLKTVKVNRTTSLRH